MTEQGITAPRTRPGFAAIRDSAKYSHMSDFAAALPAIRKKLKADLNRPGLPREIEILAREHVPVKSESEFHGQ